MSTLVGAWEANADDWTAWARQPGHDSYWRFHREVFLGLVPPPAGLTLDVGCGEGRVARDLAALGHRVVALDAAPTMARRTAEAGGLAGVLRADATALPLPDAATDLVVAFMSLHDMDDMAGAVREIGRVLRPGGRLCFAVVHPLNEAGRFRGEERDADFVISGDYFERRRTTFSAGGRGLAMTFEAMHRPLQDYFAALAAAGLLTETLREVRTSDGSQSDRIPWFIDARAVRSRERPHVVSQSR
jgi:SAM-dependent methyltransferase